MGNASCASCACPGSRDNEANFPATADASSSGSFFRTVKVRYLSVQDVLDVFDDFRDKVELLKYSLDDKLTAQEAACLIAQETTPKPKGFEEQAIIEQNLTVAHSILSASQENVLRNVRVRIDKWRFDTTGRVDVAPKLDSMELEGVTLSQFDMSVIRQVAFPMRPNELHHYSTVFGMSEKLFAKKEQSETPVAIITVGAPGSGKDYICMESEHSCTSYLETLHGVKRDQYVEINPDFWVENLCKNNNAHRDLGNFINLEHLFYSIRGKHHIIFNGTGKNVRNTLGRVTSRLKEANYKIYFCIVLASFSTVVDRIEQRRRKIGRDVPTQVVRDMFKDLEQAVPLYIENQEKIADSILIYDNSDNATLKQRPGPKFVVSSGVDSKEAVEFARKTLSVPELQKA